MTASTPPTIEKTAGLQDVARPQRARWMVFLAGYSRNFFAVLGAFIVLGFILVGLFAPWIATYDYDEQDLNRAELAPSLLHPLGTDRLGRDQFSRMIWATRTALIVAPASVTLGLIIGIFLGAVAGFFGGWVDTIIMRIADVLFAFPGLLFALLITATLGPRMQEFLLELGFRDFVRSGFAEFIIVIAALSIVGWPSLARLVRGQILALREQPYVEAAITTGATPWWILTRHLLPNAMPPVIVSVSLGLGNAVLAESTLSFFGIGIQPPIASWGQMIFNNFEFWRQTSAIWLVWTPGLAVALIVFAFNFIGDGLNEALDPRR